MTDKKSAPNYRVPALEKGLDVLEILSTNVDPLSLSQISEISGKSASELFRTLNCLVDRDFVAKEEISGKYVLTLKLYELSKGHSPLDKLLDVAQNPMEECARRLGESCHISVMRHNMIAVIAQAHPPRRVRLSISIGATFPAIHTVSGRLLMSAMSDETIDGILAKDTAFQAMDAETQQQYLDHIYRIRETGISTAVDESYIGLHDTAMLIGNPKIGLGASLAVTQLTATHKRRDPEETVAAIRETAREINELAGLSMLEHMV